VRIRGLHALARLHGIQTRYLDMRDEWQHATPEGLLAALRALGAPVAGGADVPDALRGRRLELARRGLEPVAVAWDGLPPVMELRLPAAVAGTARCELRLEDGPVRCWTPRLEELAVRGADAVEGERRIARQLALPGPLPPGYHRLVVEAGDERHEALVIAAPLKTFTPPGRDRRWGAFLPLYSLRTERDWGAGDLTDLERLTAWIGELGGSLAGTLPLLATFLDEPFEPSPYSPASRLFWNELYLDPERAPNLAAAPAARRLLESPALAAEKQRLRALEQVDYRALAALKRPVLQALADAFFGVEAGASAGADDAALARFLEEQPLAESYARFRATGERRREVWHLWPARLRGGELREGDYDEAARRYHLYVQWLADRQLSGLSDRCRAAGSELYLDLPLGVNPDGFDVWREQDVFARGVSAGAPPDSFFTRGQSWGFPPLAPDPLRATGYRYLAACLRNHMRHAGVLRLDHVMALHRLYWVPDGLTAREGVYVQYRQEELHAVLSLESHRHRAVVVGEDLGTVPRAVRTAMARHDVQRMFIVQYELDGEAAEPLRPPSRHALAGLNTHDMFPWAAFWRGLDLDDRLDLGLLDRDGVAQEQARRGELRAAVTRMLRRRGRIGAQPRGSIDAATALAGVHRELAAGAASIVLVNLEDLWQETRPQNVPGTTGERPNWRRKAARDMEAIAAAPDVVRPLREIDGLRRDRPGSDGSRDGT
jgi:4-alpha-glucanotransferase